MKVIGTSRAAPRNTYPSNISTSSDDPNVTASWSAVFPRLQFNKYN